MFGNVNPKLYFINNFLNKVDLMDIIEYGQLDKKSQLIYKDVLEFYLCYKYYVLLLQKIIQYIEII